MHGSLMRVVGALLRDLRDAHGPVREGVARRRATVAQETNKECSTAAPSRARAGRAQS